MAMRFCSSSHYFPAYDFMLKKLALANKTLEDSTQEDEDEEYANAAVPNFICFCHHLKNSLY
jgi:hypothetical protein